MSKKVSDILPKTEILAQLAEEPSELAQAALKLRRALDGTNPTPKSVEECLENIQEDIHCLTRTGTDHRHSRGGSGAVKSKPI